MSENIQIKHSTIPEHIIKHNKVDPEQILLEELTKKYGQRFIDYRNRYRKYLEDNTEICNDLFSKFRNALTIAS